MPPEPPRRDRPSAEYSQVGGAVHPNQRAQTLTGLAPPPRRAPRPPAEDLESALESPPPVSMVPLPFDDAERPTFQRSVRSAGGQIHKPAAESTPLPSAGAVPAVTPSVMARAEKLPLAKWLIIIGTTCGGLAAVATAVGTQVSSIITALRPASNDELRKKIEAIESRIAGENGVTLEAKARQEQDEKIEKRLETLESSVKTLAPAPSATIQGLAPPK